MKLLIICFWQIVVFALLCLSSSAQVPPTPRNFTDLNVRIESALVDSQFARMSLSDSEKRIAYVEDLIKSETQTRSDMKWNLIRNPYDNGSYLLENMQHRGYYLAFERSGINIGVGDAGSSYPYDKNHLTFDFVNCVWYPERNAFKTQIKGRNGQYIGKSSYYVTNGFASTDPATYWWVYIPQISEEWETVARITNAPGISTTYEISVAVGMSYLRSTTQATSVTIGTEIGGDFKAISVSVSASISRTWSTTSESTYSEEKTQTISIDLEGGTYEVQQLVGSHGDFRVKTSYWNIIKIA